MNPLASPLFVSRTWFVFRHEWLCCSCNDNKNHGRVCTKKTKLQNGFLLKVGSRTDGQTTVWSLAPIFICCNDRVVVVIIVVVVETEK